MTDIQHTTQQQLMAAIQSRSERKAPALLREINNPSPTGDWWQYVDETVKDVWPTLPLEARLITALAALETESMDSLAMDRDLYG